MFLHPGHNRTPIDAATPAPSKNQSPDTQEERRPNSPANRFPEAKGKAKAAAKAAVANAAEEEESPSNW